MKKLLLVVLVLAVSASATFGSYRYRVKNYCDNVAHDTWRHTSQSVLDDTWIHPDDAGHPGDVHSFTLIEVVEHDKSVKSRYDPTSGLPGSPDAGDSYISTATANDWTIHYLYIYNDNFSIWEEEIAHEGHECWVDDENHEYINNDGIWEKSLELPLSGMLSVLIVPPGNDTDGVGWYTKTDSAEALSNGSPVTASVAGFHSHYVIDVSSSAGHPYTITATGTSIDEATGTETGSDTEAISVTGDGSYQTTKSWVDPVVFTIPAGKTCTIDVYRTSYWDRANYNFEVVGYRLEFLPDAATWSIRLRVRKVASDGSISDIEDVIFANPDTPPRAANGEIGKHKRTDFSVFVEGADSEGIIYSVTHVGIERYYFELRYNK